MQMQNKEQLLNSTIYFVELLPVLCQTLTPKRAGTDHLNAYCVWVLLQPKECWKTMSGKLWLYSAHYQEWLACFTKPYVIFDRLYN